MAAEEEKLKPEEPVEEEREEKEEITEVIDKLYKALSELGKGVEKIASYVKSASEVTRGLTEVVGKMESKIDKLNEGIDEIRKFAVGWREAAAEHKSGKYSSAGTGEGEAVGEKVEVKPESVREPGAEMLKAVEDLKKSVSVIAPRPAVSVTTLPTDMEGKINNLIKGILSGEVRREMVHSELRKIMRGEMA
ncbi:MAG: hypothetical protein QXF58_05110 [Desulfurococcaceae archaeon]